jgi:RNA polymerase sigma-70 factor (ECF subfamily)
VPIAPATPSSLLALARAGDQHALGQLLEDYRQYLRLLARSRVGRELRVRLDPSDLVQETLLEAQRDFRQFVGESDAELGVWLRQILVRNLADQCKHHHSQKRDFDREQPLESLSVPELLAAPLSTPSGHAVQQEQAGVLATAMARLPADYREVVTMRHLEGQSFEAIAARLGRTSGAVRMVWLRAIERLGGMLEAPDASA